MSVVGRSRGVKREAAIACGGGDSRVRLLKERGRKDTRWETGAERCLLCSSSPIDSRPVCITASVLGRRQGDVGANSTSPHFAITTRCRKAVTGSGGKRPAKPLSPSPSRTPSSDAIPRSNHSLLLLQSLLPLCCAALSSSPSLTTSIRPRNPLHPTRVATLAQP